MRAAELTAHRIYDTYHLGELPDDVKRHLAILFMSSPEEMKRKSYLDMLETSEEECGLLSESSPIDMSLEGTNARLSAAEEDAVSGRCMSCDEMHSSLEAKFPWLCE